MPNGYELKEYDNHLYDPLKNAYCQYGCGCWTSIASSGKSFGDGPAGIDPFGRCPKNPKNEKLLGGNADREYLIIQRIRDLESQLYDAKEQLKAVEPNKADLVDELKTKLTKNNQLLAELRRLIVTDI